MPQAPQNVVDDSLLRSQGFSEALINTLAQTRGPATNMIYSKVRSIFLDWYVARECSDVSPPVSRILEFLLQGFAKGLCHSTLKVQIAAHQCLSVCNMPWTIY